MLQRNLTLDYQGFPDKHDTVWKKRRKTAEEDNPVGYTCVCIRNYFNGIVQEIHKSGQLNLKLNFTAGTFNNNILC